MRFWCKMKNKFFIKTSIFFRKNSATILSWIIILVAIVIGLIFHIDKKIITILVLLFGILGNVYLGIASAIALIPIFGPLIVKVLSLPIFWLINAFGYYVSVLAIKKGYKKDILNYRVITIIFLVGFTLGFVIARLI